MPEVGTVKFFNHTNGYQDLTSVLHLSHGKPQILRIILGTSVAPTHHCQRDSRQGGQRHVVASFLSAKLSGGHATS